MIWLIVLLCLNVLAVLLALSNKKVPLKTYIVLGIFGFIYLPVALIISIIIAAKKSTLKD